MMNTNQCIYLFLGVLVLVVIIILYCKGTTNEHFITVDEACQQKATSACAGVYQQFVNSSISDTDYMYDQYEQCLSKSLKSCLCTPDTLSERTKDCLAALDDADEHIRVLGCYDATLSDEEKIACRHNPYEFLGCQEHPERRACQELSALCDISDFCGSK